MFMIGVPFLIEDGGGVNCTHVTCALPAALANVSGFLF
jgi:hypothetical protein